METIDTKALENAIKHLKHKIEKQGLISNARDQEHLQRLKELKKELDSK